MSCFLACSAKVAARTDPSMWQWSSVLGMERRNSSRNMSDTVGSPCFAAVRGHAPPRLRPPDPSLTLPSSGQAGRGGDNGGMDAELWTAVDDHLTTTLLGPDPDLDAALADSTVAGLPAINVAPNQGKLLSLLVRIAGARRVLEVGTLGGYSTIWLARALPADGTLVTLELEEHNAGGARRNLERAGLGDRVEVRVGPAADTLAAMVAEGTEPFDLVFLDADKGGYPTYLE